MNEKNKSVIVREVLFDNWFIINLKNIAKN